MSLFRGLPCFLMVFLCLVPSSFSLNGCDRTFDHNEDNVADSGEFVSPGWPDSYPLNENCLYRFIGRPRERVEIKFIFFDIQGVLPLCRFDYIDIYAQVRNVSQSLLDTPLLGRFCDDSLEHIPKLIISTSNIIVVNFFSDEQKSDAGFRGTYRFIDGSAYEMGFQANRYICNYSMQSTSRKKGFIVSPTFPGFYPDNQRCYYEFQGLPGERIKLQFLVFSLFHGGDYCPFDYIQVRDGKNSKASVIGKFCGNYSNIHVFSTYENLFIEFVTGSGRVDLHSTTLDNNVDFLFDRRGFNISYEFSSDFVQVDELTKNDIEHLRGTECDVVIKSRRRSKGPLMSPGYPQSYPINVTCRFFLDGLSNSEELEKVKISFQDFAISGNLNSCLRGYLKSDDNEKFCGTLYPPDLKSISSRMTLTLDTHGSSRERGFLANYEFIKDFNISGEQVGDKCQFMYKSTTNKIGTFNSPRNPGSSLESKECIYIFYPNVDKKQKLLISFLTFSLGPNQHNDICDGVDNLAVYDDFADNSQPLNRYCGQRFPGPILARGKLKIVFKVKKKSFSSFGARYEFISENYMRGDCGKDIVSRGSGGLLKNPNYPKKYKNYAYCKWDIKASQKTSKILLQFFFFHVEGKSSEGLGCQNAVMRVYNGSKYTPRELCGPLSQDTYLSQSNTIQLEFLTSGTALEGKGFKISWTEVYENNNNNCYRFLCSKSRYCIDSNLKCNKEPNCGGNDDSDEVAGCQDPESEEKSQSGPAEGKFEILHIAIGASISAFFCIILVICACGLYHRRFRSDRKPPDNDHVEVRYVAAASSCNTTDRLLSIDHINDGRHTPLQNTPIQTPNQIHKSPHSSSPVNNTVNKTVPDKTVPNRTGPDRTIPNRSGPEKTLQNRTGPDKPVQNRTPHQTPSTPTKSANQNTVNTSNQSTPNQTPNISTANRTTNNNRPTTRIQKVSIV